MSEYWQDRGLPWEHDAGPPKNRRWPRLFAQTPNYRALGKEVLGREAFRWHFGPMFYRGRLGDNAAKVLVIGQEGAQDESLSHRSFTGGTGARMQYFLNYLGITYSYLFLNTFVYPIFGQYGERLKPIAQDPDSPIVQHRHKIFDYVLERNDLQLVVAVGTAAKESVVSWIKARGGVCPDGPHNLSTCQGTFLDPHTRVIGVRHPGGAGQGGSITAIINDFKSAIRQIQSWMDDDSDWLVPDPGAQRQFGEPYKYRSAPIPFHDLPYGAPLRPGRGRPPAIGKTGNGPFRSIRPAESTTPGALGWIIAMRARAIPMDTWTILAIFPMSPRGKRAGITIKGQGGGLPGC